MSTTSARPPFDLVLLAPSDMAEADRLTIGAGTPGIVLMERAGAFVADVIGREFPGAGKVAFLAGPGNNGGDAFIAARHLAEAGIDATLFLLVPRETLTGDAAEAAASYRGETTPLDLFSPEPFDLVVDGLFGAGLSRPIEGRLAGIVRRTTASGVPVVAIDLPSGVSGESGAILGEAFEASVTATFFRRKPGHLLQPGRARCGRILVGDIGISDEVLDTIGPTSFANAPGLWRHALRLPAVTGHKYDRGHAVVFSGGATATGAARLAAMAALRSGAGLVSLFSPSSALLVNATHLTAIMLKRCEDAGELGEHLGDARLNAFVLGPGFGIGAKARDFARAILGAGRALVLDADALTAFQEDPGTLFAAIRASRSKVVMTPHAGEFRRLFPDLADEERGSKPERARAAAERSGAVVVLKGADTVVAAPDGRVAINETGTPFLATAGSGDVLAGMVGGWLSQGMPAFEAAAASVWMHGRAAERFGPGLIAEDLPGMLPGVLAEIAGASGDAAHHQIVRDR